MKYENGIVLKTDEDREKVLAYDQSFIFGIANKQLPITLGRVASELYITDKAQEYALHVKLDDEASIKGLIARINGEK